MNGWAHLDTEAEVRESKKEFGESEVVLICNTCAVLSSLGQLFQSAELKKSPFSFLIPWSHFNLIMQRAVACLVTSCCHSWQWAVSHVTPVTVM